MHSDTYVCVSVCVLLYTFVNTLYCCVVAGVLRVFERALVCTEFCYRGDLLHVFDLCVIYYNWLAL